MCTRFYTKIVWVFPSRNWFRVQNLHYSFKLLNSKIHLYRFDIFHEFFYKLYWALFWDFVVEEDITLYSDKSIKPYNFNLNRLYNIIIPRISDRHSKYTHSKILNREQQLDRMFCECPLTIQCIPFQTVPTRFRLSLNFSTMTKLCNKIHGHMYTLLTLTFGNDVIFTTNVNCYTLFNYIQLLWLGIFSIFLIRSNGVINAAPCHG